ncbi:MAG: Transmembrane osmosensor [Chrysothrix sp. TS-e1954]|nr:MAG: Transmembrane osmosensor [Chrysothrix sp. TS-e1954]
MVASDSAVGFLATGLFLSISTVNGLIYNPNGAEVATGAMFILLSMLAIMWILYFGSQPQAAHRQFIDSFALHRGTDGPSRHVSSHMSNTHFGQQNNASFTNNTQQNYNRNHLTGFETSSPANHFPPQNTDSGSSPAQPGVNGATSPQNFGSNRASNNPLSQVAPSETDGVPTEYPYRARAIYSYEANPDDDNEISFSKHEILEVSDVSGRWWQAKKSTGETGIAPSNYLILL